MNYFKEGQLEQLQEETGETGFCRNCGYKLDIGAVTGFLGKHGTAIECEVCTPIRMHRALVNYET